MRVQESVRLVMDQENMHAEAVKVVEIVTFAKEREKSNVRNVKVQVKEHGHAGGVMGMDFVLNAEVMALFGVGIHMSIHALYAEVVAIVIDVMDQEKRP